MIVGAYAGALDLIIMIFSCQGKNLTAYLLLTFFLTTVFLNVGFEIPIFRMGSRMFLKSGEVSGSSVSCPTQNPAKLTVKSRNETMGVIF